MQQQITTLQNLINTVTEYCVNYSFQVVGALIILVLGWVAASWTSRVLLRLFEKKKLDVTLSRFLASFAKVIVLAFAVIIALGKFGITIAPFIAALGAMAFGVSVALQGPLSNYGAGVSIILSRPFVVGDTVTISGINGVVEEVTLAATILRDEDKVKITIPNKDIVGQIIQNSSANRIVEGIIGISYDADPEKAIAVIQKTMAQFTEISQHEKPKVGIQSFGDSSINIGYRYWIPTQRYFQVLYAINLAIYKSFQEAKIAIPFPQRDIRIISGNMT